MTLPDNAERTIDPRYDPAFLPEFYIDWVFGNCCEPVVFHGDGILVSTSAPIRPGDLVSITARTRGERQGLTNGFVKQFVGWETDQRGGRFLVTMQINPNKRRLFAEIDVIALHRVVSVLTMGGVPAIVERLERIFVSTTGSTIPLGRGSNCNT